MNRTTIPAPPNEAEVAFQEAARRAREAHVNLIRSIRRHPSTKLALADVEAALDNLEAARARVKR